MAGTNNFQIFNPLKNNQKSDAAYESDTMRSGGAVSGVFPASTFNKMMYQLSVFIYAFAESLKTKGYEVEDTDVADLIAVFSEVLTLADNIQSDWNQTDSGQLDYIKNKPTIIDPVNADWNATSGLAQILNKPTILTTVANFQSLLESTGYQKLPSGLIFQWGQYDTTMPLDAAFAITFPISFTSTCFGLVSTMKNPSGSYMHSVVQTQILTKTGATLFSQNFQAGTVASVGCFWWVIGI